jgi:hypothetical protein
MGTSSSSNQFLLSLVHLRSNALAAVDLTGGRIATAADIENLDAIAREALGVSLENVQCVPDEGTLIRIKDTVNFLEAFFPPGMKNASRRFLLALEERLFEWLMSDVVYEDS